MELNKALSIAQEKVRLLAPHCDIIHIAGSCRRKKPEVKDIEIVCLSKKETIWTQGDFFSPPTSKGQTSGEFGMVVNGLGRIIKGNPYGKYMQIALPEGINLDLFMPDAHDYYRQLAIRTGSADYARLVIATGWKMKGWCGSDMGLRKISDCQEAKQTDGKSKWKCINPDGEQPPVWASEQEFFDWLGVKWIAPELRSLPY